MKSAPVARKRFRVPGPHCLLAILVIGASWLPLRAGTPTAAAASRQTVPPAPAPASAPVAAKPAPAPAKPAAPAAKPASAAKPAPAAKPAAPAVAKVTRISDTQKDFCNLLWGCALPVPAGYCPDQSTIAKPKFTYDSARCLEARTLTARGVGPSHPLIGYNLYRFLGMEYRVLYTVEDELPISEARLAYLLADLPLSARLVSHFMDEPYTAEYIDPQRTHFKGTKGKRLKGDATLISGSSDEKRLFYFGYGVATVAWWTLRGPALMDFSYAPAPGKDKVLKYKMKLLVFPGNGVINGIMNLGLFKKVVLGKVKEVLNDITGTAQKLAAGGSAEILKSKDWSAEEKQKIEAFMRLP
ncbi:MAG: hypothetical protein JWO30_938 [Fibrobacteres bacterium]|nr:hypothetical protein [Fibrobacterota bacterium]